MLKLAQVPQEFYSRVAAVQELNQRITSEQDADKRAILKVASRWVQASIELDYDIFLRLQVLEGAYTQRIGHWWTKGKAALPIAKQAYAEDSVDPTWFSPTYTGMYGILASACKKGLQSYRVPLEPFDIINNALMGIPLDPTKRETLHAPFEAGKKNADKIKAGIETPLSIGGGILSRYLVRKIGHLGRHVRRNHLRFQDTNEEGNPVFEIPDDSAATSFRTTSGLLTYIIFQDRELAFGKKLRALLMETFSNPKRSYSKTMVPWLQDALKGQAKNFKDYAKLAPSRGDSEPTAQNFSQNHWDPAWRDFFLTFLKTPDLVRSLEIISREAGVDWDRRDSLKLKPPRWSKGKVKASVDLLVQRWF